MKVGDDERDVDAHTFEKTHTPPLAIRVFSLDVVDHREDVWRINTRWIFGRMKSGEADALEDAWNALTRIDVRLVEADKNALHIDVFAMFEKRDEIVA